ncbi:MAG: hypothetical protein IKD18_01430 [Clostridia bacterium]|nr:hypothetical protein [Clostridia bacterium]
MKKLLALLLCFVMILSIVSCGSAEAPATTSEAETKEETKKTEEKKETKEEAKELVIEDTSMIEKLNAIPIANDSMTEDELRKICVDYMRLACSFCYTPSEKFTYTVESQEVEEVENKGTLYAGLPYVTAGSGSLYRVANYYNPETGVITITPFLGNARWFGNACSGGVCTAWSRVVNTVKFGYTKDMTQGNGYINVGPYTYPNDFTTFEDNHRNNYDAKAVIKDNSEQIMYESYAATKPADGIVNTGHVRMVVEMPNVVRNADGTIDGNRSTLIYCDQICYNTSEKYKRTQSDGTVYFTQGGVDIEVTFAELYGGSYLPFTFKEFLGTDPVDKAVVTASGIEGKTSIAYSELQNSVITSNYNISDVVFTMRDESGKILIPSRYLRSGTFFIYSVNLAEKINDAFPSSLIHNFAKDGGILDVSVQLYNGELINVYTGSISIN